MPDNDNTMLAMSLGELKGLFIGVKESLDKNTDAVDRHTECLAQGNQRMSTLEKNDEAQTKEIDIIKKTAPCLNGKPLPPGCPGIASTQTVEIPIPPGQTPEEAAKQAGDIAAAMSTLRLAKRFWNWAQKRGHLIASVVLALLGLGSLFGGKIGAFFKAAYVLFAGGTPPVH